MVHDRRDARPRRKTPGSRRALLAAVALWAAFPVTAGAQTIGLRGPVEEDDVAAALHQPSLANRPSALKKKGAAKTAEKVAPKRLDVEQPEIGDDPNALSGGENPDDEPVVIEATPAGAAPEPIETETTATEPAPDEIPDPAKAIDRVEGVEDSGANERALTDNARASPLDNRDITADAAPYAALGVHAGRFLLKPSLEQGVSWTSNASSGGAAFFSETTLRLSVESEWSRHAASLNAYGTWLQPLSGSAAAEPKAGVDGALRLDLQGPWTADVKLNWALARETADSAVAPPVGASRPLLNRFGASASVAKDEGKARLAATLAVERSIYGDATLSGGGTLSQQERDQTVLSATLRGGYEVSPAFVPFAEVEFGRRIHDLTLDTAGYARSGTQVALRAGFEFDRDEKLNGELALGWLREEFDDSRLAAISGLSFEGTANWSPFRDTTVTLKGSTTVESSTTAGRSGSLLHAADLSAKRQLRANLSAEAGLSASLRDYSGSSDTDTILAASAGFTWWMNRHLGLTGRARHEVVQSTISGNSSATTSFFLGLKLQR